MGSKRGAGAPKKAIEVREARPWLVFAGAALLAAIVYANSLGGAFVYDDTFEIRDNPDLRRPSFVLEAFTGKPWSAERGYGFTYRPLSWSVAGLLYQAGGGSPLPFHGMNILLHALNTFLLGLLCRRLLESAAVGARMAALVSGAAAFLFAAHPGHAEAVAWASGRSDLLATALLLGSWLVFLGSEGRAGRAALSALLLLAALLSKETAAAGLVLIPAAALAIGWLRGGGLRASLARFPLRAWSFHVGALVLSLGARLAALGQIGRGAVRGSAMLNPLEGAGLVPRLLTSVALLAEHARLLIWPARLSVEYSYDQIPLATTPLDPRLLVALLAAAVPAILWWFDRRWGRAALALEAIYAAAALPTSNLLPLPAAIFSERYLYLPSAALCAGAALVIAGIASRRSGAGIAAVALLAAAGSARTIERNRDWRDAESLYRSSIEAAPRAARLHYNLGVVLRDQGRPLEAEASFAKALAIAPDYADARAESGAALVALGRVDEAAAEMKRAVELAPADPVILNDLGGAYLLMGKGREALPLLRRAVDLDPLNVEALSNLGKAALDLGDPNEARRAYESVLAIDADDEGSLVGLGASQAASGDLAAAIRSFRSALRIRPEDDDASYNLARALLLSGDIPAALQLLERLNARHPEDAEILRLLDQARRPPG